MKNKVSIYYVLIIFLILLTGVSTFLVFYFYGLKDEKYVSEFIYINDKEIVDYKVKLATNDYYSYDETEDSYVTDLIENVNTYFNYTKTFSEKVTGEYSYTIVGSVISNDGNNSTENILYKSDNKKYELDGNVINVTDKVDIDVKKIISDYNLFTKLHDLRVDSSIEYKIIINYQAFSEHISKSLSEEKILYINIPISDITKIITSGVKSDKSKEYSELSEKNNELFYVICLEFVGASIIFVLLTILLVKRIKRKSEKYTSLINKIIKENKIVILNELPDLSKYDCIFVDSFDDLLDASSVMFKPINMYEVINKRLSVFIIMSDKYCYVYKIELEKL